MKISLSLLLLVSALMILNFSYAQPGLIKIQQTQNRLSPGIPPVFTLVISPKNKSLGSVLFSPSANIQMADARQWLSGQLQLRPGVDELKKSHTEPGHAGMQVVKMVQYYKGIKVEHSTINVAGTGGKMSLIQMEFYSIADNFIITPAINEGLALQNAMKHTGAKKFVWEDYAGNDPRLKKPVAELVIIKDYSNTTDTLCLAYKFLITGSKPSVSAYVYVNAITGSVELANNNIIEAVKPNHTGDVKKDLMNRRNPPFSSAENPPFGNSSLSILSFTNSLGIANTLYSGTQNIITDEATHIYPPFATYYRLNQSINGFNVETRNGRDNFGPTAWVENPSNFWTTPGIDDTALEVHFNLQVITEYWQKRFGRNSYDNDNADVTAYVHLTDTVYAANAFWGVSTILPPVSTMNYGDGIAARNIGPYVSLDITAHEFGHAIASSDGMPQFVYQRESGALNEGFSDIWAACIENYGKDSFPTSVGNKKMWMIGEEPNHGDASRDFINPKNNGNADTYYGSFYNDVSVAGCPIAAENNDYCKVHDNSSILTKWFSLLTIGGTGTNDHNYSYNVAGVGFGTSDSIAYNTERLLTSNTDYYAVMNTSINYTSWKYGAGSNQLKQVIAAWRAVGVLDTLSFDNINIPLFGANNSFTCVAVGKAGHVWAGTSGKGLFKYDDIEWKKYDIAADAALTNKVSYRDMKVDRKGGILIAQSGYSGVSGITNSSGGVYYFNDTSFEHKKYFGSSPIAYKRNTISRNVTSLWVDTSRYNDIAASRGKVLPQVWITSLAQTTATSGLNSSVGTCGGVAMGLTDTIELSPNCCMTVPYDSNFMKVSTPYLTNVDNRATLRGAQTIGGNSDEVWVYADANDEVSLGSWGYGANYYNGSPQQIMRYDASNGDSLGVYTSANVSQLGLYFIAKAIYFDKNGNRWLGLLNNVPPYNNAIVVMDNRGNWHSSSSIAARPDSSVIFPPGTLINNNAIAGDKDGTVYIGTNNGLVVYSGGPTGILSASPLEDYKSYRRYTTNDGLPSNTIRGLAIDTFRHGVWLATDNGIVLWRQRGAARQISVSKIDVDKCSRDISYTINMKGKFFNKPAVNQLITELSDGNGNFNAPTVLETENWYEPIFENDPAGFSEFKKIVLPLTIPNGDNYLIRVRATNPVFIGALSSPFAIKKPTAILPSTGAVSHSADRECVDGGRWTNYYYSNGTPNDETDDILLLSLFKGNSYIGKVGDGVFDVTVAATQGAGSNFGINVSNAFINNPFVSMNRFWKVTPTIQPTANVAVRFYYNSQDLVDVNGSIAYGPIDHSKLVFYKTNGNPDPTSNFAGLTAPPISYINDTYFALDKWVYTQLTPTMHQAQFLVASFSGGSGGTTPNSGPLSTLPLRLVSFSARISNAKTLLQWETAAEINTARFEVQRSQDGRNFITSIGTVTAAGNSSIRRNYSLTDAQPIPGTNYYRLKMVDKDGKTTYSPVKLVFFNTTGAQVIIYPNPSESLLNIENNMPGKRVQISITDITGRKLMQWSKANSPLLQISIAGLTAGSYVLQLSDGITVVNRMVEKK